MKIAAFRLLLGSLAWLPLSFLRVLARVLGRFPIGRRARRVDANLALAFPELAPAARARLARRNHQAMVATVLETAPLWMRPRAWLERHWMPAEGREVLDDAMRSGDGVLFVGGHLGHWEATILYGTMQFPITYLYKPPRDPALDRELTARRARFGGRFVPTGRAAMREAVRGLRRGELVGLLFDQLPSGGQSVDAPFFGQTVATMTLAWRLAQRTGCRVVMGHVVRTPGGWQPRVIALDGVADEPDAVCAVRRMNSALEGEIRRFPEQYLWRYRRFEALSPPDRDA